MHRHPAVKSRSLASTGWIVAILLIISGCAAPGLGTPSGSGERRAERFADEGQFAEAAAQYIFLASNEVGHERDRLTLLAVENWLDAGDLERATNAFTSVQRPAAGSMNAALWNTNSAAISLYRGDPEAALAVLEPMSRRALSNRDRLRVEALRADGWIQNGDPARAVELMMQRENWVDGRRGVEQNRDRLWRGLLYSSPTTLREAAEAATDDTTRGWLTLGSLAASTGQQGIGWSNGIMRWREANPGHPAFAVIGEGDPLAEGLVDYPRQIALLLPLSGRYEALGSAIQNGFLGAYFATAGALDDRQTLKIYDVNAEGGASAAYQAAVQDGAEFVVGPLQKSDVNELANDILVPVPVLTLNYLEEDALAPPGLYQFALAPEDEAASAARRALEEGHERAVAIIPNNAWGRRVLQAFATEFEGLGGTLLDYRSYTPNKQDFSPDIESLMGLTGSVNRYRRLRANIGNFSLQFDPRRRQDADFIFLAADANHGRLLKSQLKFHYSGDLPTFATSSVNSLDGRSNSDMNGIMFADVPWLIDPQPWIQFLPPSFEHHWPEERNLARLHAMGYDAYNLIGSLYAHRGGPMEEIDGATGKLFLDQYGRVHRKLAWAQFQRGEAVALPDTEIPGGPIQDISEDGEAQDPSAADEAPWDPRTQEM